MVLRREPAGLSLILMCALVLVTGTLIVPVRASQSSHSTSGALSGTITVETPQEGQAIYLPPGQSIAVFITGTAAVSSGTIAVTVKIDNEATLRNATVEANGSWTYQWDVSAGSSLGPHLIVANLNNGLAVVQVHVTFIDTPPGDISLLSPQPGASYAVPRGGSTSVSITGTATSSKHPIVVSIYFDSDSTPHSATVSANGSWSYVWTINSATPLGEHTIKAVLNNGEAYVRVTVRVVRLLFIPLVKR